MKSTGSEQLTDGEVVALGVLSELHAQNQNTLNPMLAELEPISGVNNRWALVVAGLLALTATVEGWKNTNPAESQKPTTTEKQHGWNAGYSINGK